LIVQKEAQSWYNNNMKNKAIVFDFDGPLVGSGRDKSIHILFSAYVSCWETCFKKFLHPENPEIDLEKMLKGLKNYPGAPRFQQLSAIISCLVRDKPEAVQSPAELGIDSHLQQQYKKLQEKYNEYYSSLNKAAAKKFWKVLEGVKEIIEKFSKDYDLYVASGIIQEILEKDFEHHGFDKKYFAGIMGSNTTGDIDKSVILKKIKEKGYKDILFIGDSRKDFEYARKAGVKFFKVKTSDDYKRLLKQMKQTFPDEQDVCEFSEEEIKLIKSKVLALMKLYASGNRPTYDEITTFINTGKFGLNPQ